MERMSTLLSKGEDSEIYALSRWADQENRNHLPALPATALPPINPERTLGLRFDLTIPLARYVNQHHGQLVFPHRRYHIAPVWRGERPQEGRFRQFYQCDMDTIAQDSLPKACDGETIFILDSALKALDIPSVLGPVHWHINHRSVLLAWAAHGGVSPVTEALRWMDKVEKIGLEAMENALRDLGASPSSLELLRSWVSLGGTALEKIEVLGSLDWSGDFQEALGDLRETIEGLVHRGIPLEHIFFSPLLARGLSYYSGITFEATLPHHRDLGSIAAGGRYDHLAGVLSSKKDFPGVGGSLGLSRLFGRFMEGNTPPLCCGDLLIAVQEHHLLPWYLRLGDALRQDSWRVEVYLPQASLKTQLKYAQRKGFPLVLLANGQEIKEESLQIKIMATGEQHSLRGSEVPKFIREFFSK